MKKLIRSRSLRKLFSGFSLVEVMVVIAFIATLCGIGMVAVAKAREVVKRGKLEADVATLNRSVRVYLANGGSLAPTADPAEVLARLKTRPGASEAGSIVGHTGGFVDPRVRGVPATGRGIPRAVWKGESKRFVVDTEGGGFSEFVLDNALGMLPVETESRQTVEKFATRDPWVWDYEGRSAAAAPEAPGEAGVGPGTPVVFTAQLPAVPRRLQPPSFSLPTGLYDHGNFPLPVQLINPNPDGSSRIYYTLNNGPWSVYTPGSVLNLPQEHLNLTLEAYAAPSNGEEWIDSTSATSLYQTIFFKGDTSGVFHGPAGDAGLVTNLRRGMKLSHFDWGTPAAGQSSPNSLDFAGVGSFFAVPEQEFRIGEITYANGTTYSGTNATSVQMEVTLNLAVPESVERLNFALKLQSTPNKGQSPDADADYVWIPTLSSKFSTTVQGKTFYLQLRFGPSDANSFTTIDEFHVHEHKTATGAIYGKLTTTPVF